MEHFARTWLRTGVGLAAALSMAGSGGAFAAQTARIYWGKPVAIGQGAARTFVRSDAHGKLAAVGIALTESALDGLPAAGAGWPYTLWMPLRGPKSGVDHVTIDWNPHGHPPPGIYSVPHFDFHFYYVSRIKQAEVSFAGPPGDPGLTPPQPALLPPDYRFNPEAAVPDMGVHAADMTAPEFHGKPFGATFIYGYYRGQLTFVEPMVTRAFLLAKPNLKSPVRTPQAYSFPAYYPSFYGVRYDAAQKAYIVELDGLKAWKRAASLASTR
jgi:hypothetical protein